MGRLVEGKRGGDDKLCATQEQVDTASVNGTFLDLQPDGAHPQCYCMTTGKNSCEPPRKDDERCNWDQECISGVCNTKVRTATQSPHSSQARPSDSQSSSQLTTRGGAGFSG